jgi:hypothetical protein
LLELIIVAQVSLPFLRLFRIIHDIFRILLHKVGYDRWPVHILLIAFEYVILEHFLLQCPFPCPDFLLLSPLGLISSGFPCSQLFERLFIAALLLVVIEKQLVIVGRFFWEYGHLVDSVFLVGQENLTDG